MPSPFDATVIGLVDLPERRPSVPSPLRFLFFTFSFFFSFSFFSFFFLLSFFFFFFLLSCSFPSSSTSSSS